MIMGSAAERPTDRAQPPSRRNSRHTRGDNRAPPAAIADEKRPSTAGSTCRCRLAVQQRYRTGDETPPSTRSSSDTPQASGASERSRLRRVPPGAHTAASGTQAHRPSPAPWLLDDRAHSPQSGHGPATWVADPAGLALVTNTRSGPWATVHAPSDTTRKPRRSCTAFLVAQCPTGHLRESLGEFPAGQRNVSQMTGRLATFLQSRSTAAHESAGQSMSEGSRRSGVSLGISRSVALPLLVSRHDVAPDCSFTASITDERPRQRVGTA